MNNPSNRFEKLDQLKARLDSYRPLPKAVVDNLHDYFVLQWTYHTNAIEGNTLTLKETKVVLEGITIGGKTLREHFEAINHRDAILYVETMVEQQQALTENSIKALHQLILKQIDDDNAGRYRSINVIISGADHQVPDALHVPQSMENLISWYQGKAQQLHPIERAARLHVDFVKTHPFVDGNGRTSRLLMNIELMKAGYPTIVVPVEDRLAYYQALDDAHCNNEYDGFFALTSQWLERSFEPYFRVLGVKYDS